MIAPKLILPRMLKSNKKLRMDGLKFLSKISDNSIPVSFFDPQYRGIYEQMKYGNEATSLNHKRVEIPQMDDIIISEFIHELARVLIPSGHLFLWLDKFHLCTNFRDWLHSSTCLHTVDMITWNKKKIGLGYRTRHTSEFLMVLQKEPKRAKGCWTLRDIPDVWDEKVPRPQTKYHHTKPIGLQSKLIKAVSNEGDLVIDPAAGSFSVLDSCIATGRNFLGCDIKGGDDLSI